MLAYCMLQQYVVATTLSSVWIGKIFIKTYRYVCFQSKSTEPSKEPALLHVLEPSDQQCGFSVAFHKDRVQQGQSRAFCPYCSGFLNTWHLLSSFTSGSQFWKGDKVLIVLLSALLFDRRHWSKTIYLLGSLTGLVFIVSASRLVPDAYTGHKSLTYVMSTYHLALTTATEA